MQLNTDSTTAARVEAPPWRGRVLDPVPTYAALVLAVLFFLYLSLDFSRERKWLEERKKRMAHFRDEARRRHNELVTAQIQARHARRADPPPAIKTPNDTTPKPRQLFKLYS